MTTQERLKFIEQELRAEIKQLRDWCKQDQSTARTEYGEDEAQLLARANAYAHCADQMQRILDGKTAAEALVEKMMR
jgi:hypothetical protein